MDFASSMPCFNENSDPETELKSYGSGLLLNQEADWMSLKIPETLEIDDISNSSKMLSFSSSPEPEVVLMDRSSDLPCFFDSRSFRRNTVHSSATSSFNSGYQMQAFNGISKPPFTPSQWLELEHQALIFKYIAAKIPIPSNILNPIKKALYSAALVSFSATPLCAPPLASSAYLGFVAKDSDSRRCRRTDGKKWRCSRESMGEQKYCERHLNRGRHRTRKVADGGSNVPPLVARERFGDEGSATAAQFARIYEGKKNLRSKMGHNPSKSLIGSEFGFVSSDSLLNPLENGSSILNPPHHHLHTLIDNLSKAQTDPSPVPSCPNMEFQSNPLKETHPMQLSIPLSPLRLSPVGGPLGEVLQNAA